MTLSLFFGMNVYSEIFYCNALTSTFACLMQWLNFFFSMNSFHVVAIIQLFIVFASLASLFPGKVHFAFIPQRLLNDFAFKVFGVYFWFRWFLFCYLSLSFWNIIFLLLRRTTFLSRLALFSVWSFLFRRFSFGSKLNYVKRYWKNNQIFDLHFFIFSYRLFLRSERLAIFSSFNANASTFFYSDFSVWLVSLSLLLFSIFIFVLNLLWSLTFFPFFNTFFLVSAPDVSLVLHQELLFQEWTAVINSDALTENSFMVKNFSFSRYVGSLLNISRYENIELLSSFVDSFFHWYWFQFGNGSVVLSFKVNELETIMFGVVLIITSLVLLYSMDYMGTDPRRKIFLSHIIIFSIFMCIFIASDDLITVFVGWEGVGISSFFLINFWFTRIQANKSAVKAVLVNKIGDSALLIAIAISFFVWKTSSFSVLFEQGFVFLAPDTVLCSFFGFEFSAIEVFTFCIIIAAMAKSAQIGLHTWLPDAMEGPTPVSALIHAATMVTAGILLLIKCSSLLIVSPLLSVFVAGVGIVTSVFAGSVACVQHDIKKIIAYSTCSQLGLMFMACGLGYPFFAFFHLVTHAFFKALLFLAAGSVIHAIGGSQDIRQMGGLASYLPVTNMAFLFGNLCIIGFPFFSGFYSKEILILSSSTFSYFFFILCLFSTFLTAFYSCRLYWCVMLKPYAGIIKVWPFKVTSDFLTPIDAKLQSPHVVFVSESPWRTQFVLVALTLLSCFSGFLLHDYFFFLVLQDFSYWSLVSSAFYFEAVVSTFTSLLPLIVVLLTVFLFFSFQIWLRPLLNKNEIRINAWLCFYDSFSSSSKLTIFSLMSDVSDFCKFIATGGLKFFYPVFYAGLFSAWFFNSVQNTIALFVLRFAWFVYMAFDKGIIEKIAGASFVFSFILFCREFRFIAAKSSLQQYLFWMLLFVSFVLVLL